MVSKTSFEKKYEVLSRIFTRFARHADVSGVVNTEKKLLFLKGPMLGYQAYSEIVSGKADYILAEVDPKAAALFEGGGSILNNFADAPEKIIVGPKVSTIVGSMLTENTVFMRDKYEKIGVLRWIEFTQVLFDILISHIGRDTVITAKAFNNVSFRGVNFGKISAKSIGYSFVGIDWGDNDKVKFDVQEIHNSAFHYDNWNNPTLGYPSKFWISKRCEMIDIDHEDGEFHPGTTYRGLFHGNIKPGNPKTVDVYLEHDDIPETWSDHWADRNTSTTFDPSATHTIVNIHLGVSEEEFDAL